MPGIRWSAISMATWSPRRRSSARMSSASAPEVARRIRKRSPKPRRRSRETAASTAGSSSTARIAGRRSLAMPGTLGDRLRGADVGVAERELRGHLVAEAAGVPDELAVVAVATGADRPRLPEDQAPGEAADQQDDQHQQLDRQRDEREHDGGEEEDQDHDAEGAGPPRSGRSGGGSSTGRSTSTFQACRNPLIANAIRSSWTGTISAVTRPRTPSSSPGSAKPGLSRSNHAGAETAAKIPSGIASAAASGR